MSKVPEWACDGNWFPFPREIAQGRTDLSPSARAVLEAILSVPYRDAKPQCFAKIATLCAWTRLDKKTIRKGVTALQRAGIIDKKYRIGSSNEITVNPREKWVLLPENGTPPKNGYDQGNTGVKNGNGELPQVGTPPSPKVPPNKNTKRDKLKETQGSLANGSAPDVLPSAPPPAFDFDALYETYPRKKGKKAGLDYCRKHFKTLEQYKALKKAIENYCLDIEKNKTEGKYIKYFDTFVRGGWHDYTEDNLKASNSQSPTEEVDWGNPLEASLRNGGPR